MFDLRSILFGCRQNFCFLPFIYLHRVLFVDLSALGRGEGVGFRGNVFMNSEIGCNECDFVLPASSFGLFSW